MYFSFLNVFFRAACVINVYAALRVITGVCCACVHCVCVFLTHALFLFSKYQTLDIEFLVI